MKIRLALLCLSLLLWFNVSANADTATNVFIGGKIHGIRSSTFHLIVFNKFSDSHDGAVDLKQEIDKAGKFQFRITHNRKLDFKIQLYVVVNDMNYQLSARWATVVTNDSVWVDIYTDNHEINKVQYSGKGSAAFTCWNEMDSVDKKDNLRRAELDVKQCLSECEYLIAKKKEIIQRYSDAIPYWQQQVIEADMIGDTRFEAFAKYLYRFNFYGHPLLSAEDKQLVYHCADKDQENSFLPFAYAYIRFLHQHTLQICILEMETFDPPTNYQYDYIKNHYQAKLFERLASNQLVWGNRMGKALNTSTMDSIQNDALKQIKDTSLLNYLSSLLLPKMKGQDCYPFRFIDTAGAIVTNEQLKGKVVLIDVWFTGCGGCSGYSERLDQYIYPEFKNNTNIVFLSVSGDRQRDIWLRSIYSKQYTRPENLNVYTGGNGFKDSFLEYYHFQGGPYSMILDREGKIFAGTPPTNDMELLGKLINEALNK